MQKLDLAFEACLLLGRVFVAARQRFEMVEHCLGRPHDQFSHLPDAEAKIDVVERHSEFGIEPAELVEQ